MPSTQEYRSYNVTATYPDMQRARRGVEVLEEAGVEGNDIFLQGSAAREAATTGDTEQRDKSFMNRSARTVRQGVLYGALAALVASIVIGVIVFRDNTPAIVALAAGGTFVGAGVGLLVSALAQQKQSSAWEVTLDDVAGPVAVGVHTHDLTAFEKATTALAGTEPQRLQRFDGEGNALPQE